MKEVHPNEIKVGDYYIQEFIDSSCILLKRRIKHGSSNEIWGRYIKVLKGNALFIIGDTGFVNTDTTSCKFFLLSEGEALLYMI